MGNYLTYNAYELKDLNKFINGTDFICPHCFQQLELDLDDDDTQYFDFEGDIYHADCIDELMNEHSVDYIKARCLQDFAEWYLDCRFNDTVHYEEWLFEPMFSDTDNVLTYVGDNIDDFMRYVKEEID